MVDPRLGETLAIDLARAVHLLRTAHDMYREILQASLDHVGPGEELDVPAFLRRLNGALTAFKPHDTQIAGLLARYGA